MTALEQPQLKVVPPPAPPAAGTPDAAAPSNKVRKVGLGYVWERPDKRVTFRADFIRESRDEFTAEIAVESDLPGAAGLLHQARMNLSSTQGRTTAAKHLAGAGGYSDKEWLKLVESFAVAVLRLERLGEPVVHAGNLPSSGKTADLIARLLPRGKPSIWFGPQGVGKGWLSVAACVCATTGVDLAGWDVEVARPLYLDWEDSVETFNLRIQALACGLGVRAPDIAYRKCRKSLLGDLHAILRAVAEEGATLVVVDSVGLAAGAGGDGRGYEQVALQFFEALRLMEPATVLCIDHVASDQLKGGELAGKAIGSIYKMAEARAAWEIRAQQEAGAEETHLGFYHAKFNHTQKYPPMGFKLAFAPTDPGDFPAWVKIERADIADNESLRRNLPLHDQLRRLLLRGPLTVAELEAELEEPANKLRVYLDRGQKSGTYLKLPDGRWAVAASGRNASDAAGW